jgi:hypothetical protein
MERHMLELSQSLSPTFKLDKVTGRNKEVITPFELSLLGGIANHPMSSFSIDGKAAALTIEWVQIHPI